MSTIKKFAKRAGRSKRWLLGATIGVASLAGLSADAHAQKIARQVGDNPDYHVVQDGDTLYDLSGRYYGDSYEWPRLWGNNAHITNPHWIYPGDIVYLRPPEGGGDVASQDPSRVTVDDPQRREAIGTGLHLPIGGFILADELEYAGKIRASKKEAVLISSHDSVWVGWEKTKKDEEDGAGGTKVDAGDVQEGDLFSIIRKAGDLKNPEGDKVGTKYFVVGTLRIKETSEEYYDTAEVLQSWREIYRGDLLIPYERQLRVVQPVQAEEEMVAEIIDAMAPIAEFAETHYVFVNKGAQNNVRVGNRFFIYQRFEGLDREGEEPAEKIPWRRVGQIMLIDVREQYSLGVITDSNQEVHIGDRLEMYSGY